MKKKILQLGGILLLIICIMGVFDPVIQVQAASQTDASAGSIFPETGIATLFGKSFNAFMGSFFAQMATTAIMIMGFILTLAGWLLNFSINLTLHIKEFVESTPAIYTTWKAIRDVSGMFIIFALLWAALQLILGLKGSGFGHLIKNVVVVGLLINFSFFFASVGIDASNIVSVQLYNALAPANTLNATAATGNLGPSSYGGVTDGGLSNIFMNSLKIQTIYKTGLTGSAEEAGEIQPAMVILISGVVAVIIMFVAALSFVAAAFAFILRFVILLILLAFSPIWIASYVVPQLNEYSKEWTKHYTSMLVFMPVYLLLMYLALNVLTSSPTGLFGAVNTAGIVGNDKWYASLLLLGVNAFLVCFLLNMPLVVAAKMGGVASKFIKPEKIGMGTMFKKAGGAIGTRVIGAPAAWADKKLAGTRLGNTLLARDARGATTGALAKAKMGAGRSYEERYKENKVVAAKEREINKRSEFNSHLQKLESGTPTPSTLKDLKTTISSMSEKEKLSLGKDKIIKGDVLRYFKKSDFDAIKKSDDFTDDDRDAISAARKDLFKTAVTNGAADVIKDAIKAYDGNDLLGFDVAILSNPALAEFYTQGHLNTIRENTNDKTVLDGIVAGVNAAVASGKRVSVEGWLKKQIKSKTW